MSMKKTVLTFGLISGAVSSVLMLAIGPFADRIGFDHMLVIGYTTIVLSFLLVFFGIRSYRENNGGKVGFGRALAIGLLITLISSACYVATWELIYFKLSPGFAEKYSAYEIDKVKASGANQQTIDATVQQMDDMKKMLDNPFLNAAVSFTEPFPIGVLVSLVSAAVLRKT